MPLEDFSHRHLEVWDSCLCELKAAREANRKGAGVLEEEKQSLVTLMKRNAKNPALLEELEGEFERITRELSLARIVEGRGDLEKYNKEEVVKTCIDGVRRTGEHWKKSPPEAKSRIQRLVLPYGVPYDVLTGNRTPQLSLLYNVCSGSRGVNPKMAPPTFGVTNRVLEEMIEWFKVLKAFSLGS